MVGVFGREDRCVGCVWKTGQGVVRVFRREDEVLWVCSEDKTRCCECVWQRGQGVVGVFGRQDRVLWVCLEERTRCCGCVWQRGQDTVGVFGTEGEPRRKGGLARGRREGENQFESTAKTHNICRNGNDMKYEIALSKCAHAPKTSWHRKLST